MVPSKRRRLTGRVLSVAVIMVEIGVVHADSAEVIGRYTTLSPMQSVGLNDVLAEPVTASFEPTVTTVGEAVGIVLRGTGVSVSSESNASTERATLLALPLPTAHRDLSGRSVRGSLAILAGPAFKVVEDPVHRLVSFERCRQGASPVNESVATP